MGQWLFDARSKPSYERENEQWKRQHSGQQFICFFLDCCIREVMIGVNNMMTLPASHDNPN